MKSVYVIDAIRTPVGKYGGALSSVRPDDLLANVIVALLKRNETVDPNVVEEVIAGDANQAGEDNRNVARMAALLAGLPVSVAGNTVNRLCASGLQAIMDSARQIACGDAEVVIACGVESMTRAPFVVPKSTDPFSRSPQMQDTTLGWRFVNKRLADMYYPYSMGETAENVARQWNISREEQDVFAFRSQEKYFAAKDDNKWDDEITAVEVYNKDLVSWVVNDEHPRKTSIEKLATLKPAFAKEGTVTAGNSSGINDGAAAMLLANEDAVKRFDLAPLAKIVSMAVAEWILR
jgi:acetyl-CoA C-acetyltransferase